MSGLLLSVKHEQNVVSQKVFETFSTMYCLRRQFVQVLHWI